MVRSFSPSINKFLYKKNTNNINDIDNIVLDNLLCDNLLNINVNGNCYKYDNILTKNYLLNLLNKNLSNKLDIDNLTPPKQIYSNCWFNTMFIVFFFSDKGRKFFKFFRELMIKGEKIDGNKIDKNLYKLFFILNLFIEASYNKKLYSNIKNIYLKNITKYVSIKKQSLKQSLKQRLSFLKNHKTIRKFKNIKPIKSIKNITFKLNKNYNKDLRSKDKDLRTKNNNLILHAKSFNTNYFILEIYKIIKTNSLINKFPDINDAYNPIDYFNDIFNYLNYNPLKIKRLEIHYKITNFKLFLNNNINNIYRINNFVPEIIIIDDFTEDKINYNKNYSFTLNDNIYKYKLDSIIITNKEFYLKNKNKHFVGLITINNEEYKFDGDAKSNHILERFNWKKLINTNKDWSFKENINYIPEKYNLRRGYKILFYYRDL